MKEYGSLSILTRSLIRWFTSDDAHSVSLRAPAAMTGDLVLSLPPADGLAGAYMTTDGSGNLALTADRFEADWVAADGTTKTVTHSLGTLDVAISVYDKTDGSTIRVDSELRTSVSVVTLTASEVPGAAGWRVLVRRM